MIYSYPLRTHNNQEIEQVIKTLSRITSRSPEKVKPYLIKLLEHLEPRENNSDSQRQELSYEEWLIEFNDWLDSHKNRNIPVLNEEAMSRESMYPDRW